jgi:hypothetical protein
MQSFSEFVEYAADLDVQICDIHLRQQSSLIDLNNVDFVGRFEHFGADFGIIASRLGFETLVVDQRNRSSQTFDYRSYYDEALVQRVGAIYSRDSRIFGYSFDGSARPTSHVDQSVGTT